MADSDRPHLPRIASVAQLTSITIAGRPAYQGGEEGAAFTYRHPFGSDRPTDHYLGSVIGLVSLGDVINN